MLMTQKQAVFYSQPEVLRAAISALPHFPNSPASTFSSSSQNSVPPLKVQNFSIVQGTPILPLDNHDQLITATSGGPKCYYCGLHKHSCFFFLVPIKQRWQIRLFSHVIAYCMVNLKLKGNSYRGIKLSVMKNLCCKVILGHNFLRQHSCVEIPFGGPKPELNICGLAAAKVQYPSLLAPDCKPIAVK